MTERGAATPPASPGSGVDLGGRLAGDLEAVEKELSEIDLLVAQATAEASRHEGRRAAAAEKASKASSGGADPKQVVELYEQLMTLTKRAALMESQVEVLEGKRRVLARYRDALNSYVGAAGNGRGLGSAGSGDPVDLSGMPPAVSRLLLTAQEDLRREISRAMHDGPAQSLTNIVLQAQIVERLVAADPVGARGEVRQLVAMVQQTLDAPSPSSSTCARWCSTISGWCRPSGERPGTAVGGPVSRSSSSRWAPIVGCRWRWRAGCSGSWTKR